jgi:hypothetical protein
LERKRQLDVDTSEDIFATNEVLLSSLNILLYFFQTLTDLASEFHQHFAHIPLPHVALKFQKSTQTVLQSSTSWK